MANDSTPDPAEAFRDLVTQWERNVNALANRIMGTEGYSKSMNQVQDAQLRARDAFREFMNHNLTMVNMPTRDDVVRIAEAVHDLGKRLARIETLLEGMSPAAKQTTQPRPSPPRTRKPPSPRTSEDGAEPGSQPT